jgi:heme-degrading monooxygenase HmoA
MIIELNSITIGPDQNSAFEAAFETAKNLLLRVRGCEQVRLLRCLERPAQYQVQVVWQQLKDHEDHYPQTAEATEIRALLRPFIQQAQPGHFVETPLGHSD